MTTYLTPLPPGLEDHFPFVFFNIPRMPGFSTPLTCLRVLVAVALLHSIPSFVSALPCSGGLTALRSAALDHLLPQALPATKTT
jgi:hypothetical protein